MRLIWCLVLTLLAVPQFGNAQDCWDQTRYTNQMCTCINEVRSATFATGPQAQSFGFQDGEIDCGTDLNPCTIGHVNNCTAIQGQKISPTLPGNAKVVVIATSDNKLLDSLIPFCGQASRTRKIELALVHKLKLP